MAVVESVSSGGIIYSYIINESRLLKDLSLKVERA